MQRKLLDETKACQLRQIEERKLLKEMEKDEERMWLECQSKVIQEQVCLSKL